MSVFQVARVKRGVRCPGQRSARWRFFNLRDNAWIFICKGKVVIVTEGARGIGEAIVRACAREGTIPVIGGRDAEPGKSLQNELQRRGARHRRTTHDLYSAKICYRHHLFYDTEVEVVRYLRRTNPGILVVRLPAGPQLAVPEWMLSPLVCEQLKEEAEPRIAIAALQELRQLIDIQPLLTSVSELLDRAESPVGGPHAQPQEYGPSPAETPLRDRRDLDRCASPK